MRWRNGATSASMPSTRIGGAHPVHVLRTRLLRHRQPAPQLGCQHGQGLRHHVGEHAGAERAAPDQQAQLPGRIRIRAVCGARDVGPHRHAGQHPRWRRLAAGRRGRSWWRRRRRSGRGGRWPGRARRCPRAAPAAGACGPAAGRRAAAVPTGSRRSPPPRRDAAGPGCGRAARVPRPSASAPASLAPAPRPAMPAPRSTCCSVSANTPVVRRPARPSVISTRACPRAASSVARASAGKKWPPVPPAAITTGALMPSLRDDGAPGQRGGSPGCAAWSGPAPCRWSAPPTWPTSRHRR